MTALVQLWRSRSWGLWRNPDYFKLWSAQTVSMFGTEVTNLALPLTAVLTIRATPFQMGVLVAAERAPFLLFGLLVGVWVDRLRRRRLLLVCDVALALVLLSVPLAAALHRLSIGQLFAVAFVVGGFTLLFDIAYQTYLPLIIPREDLVEGNSRVEASRALAGITAPGIAGGLVQLFTAPVAILIDCASYLVSFLFISLIDHREDAPASTARRPVLSEMADGLKVILAHPQLRLIAGSGATNNFFISIFTVVYLLYLVRELHLGAALIGLMVSIGTVGALLASMVAKRAQVRFGLGPSALGSSVVKAIGFGLVAVAGGPAPVLVATLVAGFFLVFFGLQVFNIDVISFRQQTTPPHLLGRVSATNRFLVWTPYVIGSIAAGGLAAIGLRQAMAVTAVGMVAATLWLLPSQIRDLRQVAPPAPAR
jgi:MFS family permease